MREAMNLEDFLEGACLSRAFFKELCSQGLGPRVHRSGGAEFIIRSDAHQWLLSIGALRA